jgi:hypothetical protein
MRSSKTAGNAATGESPKKKTHRAAQATGAKKPAARAASPRAPRKRIATAAAAPQRPDQGAIDAMVAEAAYYLAEKRCFAPGFEEQDWQAARQQIEAQLRAARNPMR